MKRRTFLTTSAAALASGSVVSTFAIGELGKSANSRLNVALIGPSGRITNRPDINACVKEPVREGWGYGEDLRK